ncbi:MAG: class I SAM-dependent methyltransferase [Ekhidna sp.]
MTPHEINNHFGDMDMFLMDLILKGKVSENATVLDVGCGEGRNGIYFINQDYQYTGIDTDTSKVSLIEFLSKGKNASFHVEDIKSYSARKEKFDFIICSRVLHFAKSEDDFFGMWKNVISMLNTEGIIYLSMDSVVDTELGEPRKNGQHLFPDDKVRFVLTDKIYKEIKKGFEEIEPLKTLIAHKKRAQSFMALKKISP